jgi:hypothetical protein
VPLLVMTTSSPAAGTCDGDQFVAAFQSPPLVLVHTSVSARVEMQRVNEASNAKSAPGILCFMSDFLELIFSKGLIAIQEKEYKHVKPLFREVSLENDGLGGNVGW